MSRVVQLLGPLQQISDVRCLGAQLMAMQWVGSLLGRANVAHFLFEESPLLRKLLDVVVLRSGSVAAAATTEGGGGGGRGPPSSSSSSSSSLVVRSTIHILALVVQPSGPHWSGGDDVVLPPHRRQHPTATPFPCALLADEGIPDSKADRQRFIATAAAKVRLRHGVLTMAAEAILHHKHMLPLLVATLVVDKNSSSSTVTTTAAAAATTTTSPILDDDATVSSVLRVLVHCSKTSPTFASKTFDVLNGGRPEGWEGLFQLAAEPRSKDPFSQGLTLTFLAALVQQRLFPLSALSKVVRLALSVLGRSNGRSNGHPHVNGGDAKGTTPRHPNPSNPQP